MWDAGGELREAWHLGRGGRGRRGRAGGEGAVRVHFFMRESHTSHVRRQRWQPCWCMDHAEESERATAGHGLSSSPTKPAPCATPVFGVASPASFLATGFQLKRSCIPVRVLRRVHASPRTAWQMT